MSKETLMDRSASKCELCTSSTNLSVYEVPPTTDKSDDKCLIVCDSCLGQIESPATMDENHWHCLNESAWSEIPAVQVMAWRMLQRLSGQSWAQDLSEQIYLDEETQAWAQAEEEVESSNTKPTLDSNGTVLQDGDSVTLIRDLDVKGTTFIAKRGTLVKNIMLTSNPEHIEGRVNKTKLVLKTCYMKKA